MIRRLIVAALLIAFVIGAKALFDTMRDPVVQRVSIESDALRAGSQPVTVALLADIHVAGPDMPPSRLARIVKQVNALQPDLVAIAGDLVSEKRTATNVYSAGEVIAPLGRLRATHGVVIVPGNHDHWFDWPALSAQIARHPQITILANEAAQFGPLAVGGVDDAFTGRDDLDATFDALRPLTGVKLALTHSPDIFPQVPVDIGLVLAGHTHCGQIAYPWGGAPATMSEYGDLYACGVTEQHGKILVTSGGIGTSLLPIRLFTRPEIWLIEIRPLQH
ncbi:metallophosphoesterase [Erythrobacter rubeus]|uniref:Metallophosphoesterase n=1 Tax=Erythrobacter rubeus TaxID=2760803 RepID=A0ABR8KVM6_9SPHN|nr:metallophosphoesterase [Erythrobacter rubeus]MBD2842191.1 metallophosphoesterase [Erythrobacter rubeus]